MLLDKKLLALNLLLAGSSVADIAKELKVCRVTVYRLMQDAEFIEEYNKVLREMFKKSQASILTLQEVAINKAKELIESGSEEIAAQMTQTILDRALPAHLSVEDLKANSSDPSSSNSTTEGQG